MKDRIKVKVGEVVFHLAPLSNQHKSEVASFTKVSGGVEKLDLFKSQHHYIKHSLKLIENLKDFSGDEYKLEFEGDCLTDDCVSEIFGLQERDKLLMAAYAVLNGVTDEMLEKEVIEGVSLEILSVGKSK